MGQIAESAETDGSRDFFSAWRRFSTNHPSAPCPLQRGFVTAVPEQQRESSSPAPSSNSPATSAAPADLAQRLLAHIGHVVLGKRDLVELCLVAMLAGDHVLLEDVPGVGKTLTGKALAKSIAGKFSRLQFTPDLLPSDIVGSTVYDPRESKFHFNEGPVFANVALADEINRAPPRTQSALLEAMSEAQVSVDGKTYKLPRPFVVIATQNPYEFEGTYPLPESQLDRFLLRVSVGYPNRETEKRVLSSHLAGEPVDALEPIVTCEQVVAMQDAVRAVRVEDSLYDYLLSIVERTRRHDEIHLGVSTRGALSLFRASQALAFLRKRDFVIPDDIKTLCVPVLAHRILLKGTLLSAQREAAENCIRRIVGSTEAPV
jgi:MoxR-like ATPase